MKSTKISSLCEPEEKSKIPIFLIKAAYWIAQQQLHFRADEFLDEFSVEFS